MQVDYKSTDKRYIRQKKGLVMNMRTHTFTFFTDDDIVYGYRFNITRLDAQIIAEKILSEEGVHVYYMEGFHE